MPCKVSTLLDAKLVNIWLQQLCDEDLVETWTGAIA